MSRMDLGVAIQKVRRFEKSSSPIVRVRANRVKAIGKLVAAGLLTEDDGWRLLDREIARLASASMMARHGERRKRMVRRLLGNVGADVS